MEEFRNAYRIIVGRLEGKRTSEKLRCRWEGDIKMDLKVVDCEARKWMNLAQNQNRWWTYVRVVMNLWVPSNPIR